MKKRVIYGASGHGKVIADIIELNGHLINCFIDDDKSKWGKNFFGYKIQNLKYLFDNLHKNEFECIVAIGDCKTRERIVKELNNKVNFFQVIHPSAKIAKNINIGVGTVVMANVVINADSSIGNHCIINTSSSLDHDCNIRNFVHISPGAHLGGGVVVEDFAWVGLGVSIINNIRIGANSIVGAGSVVIRDVDHDVVVMGNPAKYFRGNI